MSETTEDVSRNDVNQEGMVRLVAKRAGVRQDVVREVLRAFYDEVAETLSRGGRIRITNFGSFTAPLKSMRNPFNGTHTEPTRYAHWAPRGRLRDIVAGRTEPGSLKKANPDRPFLRGRAKV